MSIYQIMMAVFFVLGAALSLQARSWRGLAYLAALAFSYFASSAWWRSGLESGELFTGICDVIVCVIIVMLMRRLWEVWLLTICILSLGVSLLYLAANLSGHWMDHEAYSILLEVLNVVAIFTISGVAAFEFNDRTSGVAFRPVRMLLGFVLPSAR